VARRPKTIGARPSMETEVTFAVSCFRVCVDPDFASIFVSLAAPSFAVSLVALSIDEPSVGRVRLLGAVSRVVSITLQSEGRRRIFVSTSSVQPNGTRRPLSAAPRRVGPAFSSRGRID
jgi:hypothetical protein